MAVADAPLTSVTDPNNTPMGPVLSPGPGVTLATAPGLPVAQSPTPDLGSLAQSFLPPAAERLGRNPMLPQHPVSAALDAQYLAAEAELRSNIAKQYANILSQLGFTDENGNFIPGSVSTNAARQEADARRSSNLAAEEVTQQAQKEGTLFSGTRGTRTARAEYPFQQTIQDLGINVPLTLSQLHEQAAGLVDQYNIENAKLLADAAARAAAAITQHPSGVAPAPIQSGGFSMPAAPQPSASPQVAPQTPQLPAQIPGLAPLPDQGLPSLSLSEQLQTGNPSLQYRVNRLA